MAIIKSHTKKFQMVLFLLLTIILVFPTAGMALTECTTPIDALCAAPGYADCDQDGFTDSEECIGFKVNEVGTCIPGIQDQTCQGVNDVGFSLNPRVPDLIYTVTDAAKQDINEGNTPDSLLLRALGGDSNSGLKIYADGLYIRTHRIDYLASGVNRWLTNNVRAAWIKESGRTTEYLGETASYSVPTDADAGSTIYTQMIFKEVEDNCGNINCAVANTTINNKYGNEDIVNYYILEVVAHEMGHGSRLAPTNARSYYHYKGSSSIMTPAAVFRKGLYKISTVYDPDDPGSVQLK